ncbi:hypothetical protein NLM27_41655 [Bradyrhizobium sp. CCGB12]|uniref:hypothetical protein n=1 Tax=Bradyrhizobium sp. CCGB12 TaxID=2949632 RepID=UPI0020B36CA3|nr:hypothetical protein [Bradyrhizobium sp. CCGB12]MCP3395241.1 hypothetical protein [Bradyrhizobium sp. CCGB12]
MPVECSSDQNCGGNKKQVRYPRVLEICAELGLEIIPTKQRLRAGQTKADSVLHAIYEDHGEGHLVLLLRTLLESDGNSVHVNDFVLRGLSDVMLAHPEWPQKGLAWLEAFDSINLGDIRAKARANRQAVPQRHGVAAGLFRELAKAFAPPPKPEPPRVEKKLLRSVTRIPENRAKIELGTKLLALRERTPNNRKFGELVRTQCDMAASDVSAMMRVCRLYGDREEIWSRLSWTGLLALSAPTLPDGARERLEQRIAAGERIGLRQIALTSRASE